MLARAPRRKTARKTTATAGASGPATRARTRLEVDERRAQLVELGLAEFGSGTYDDVSIDRIAQMAGISKGLLYHYFPTKRAFYTACVREAAARLLARMAEVPKDGPPLEGLRLGIEAYLEYVRGHARAYATLMRSSIGIDRELAAIVDETRATLLANLTRGMEGALAPGSAAAAPPLLTIALRGWVGLAEAASIAWVEACVDAESRPRGAAEADGSAVPDAARIRDLLATALLAIMRGVVPAGPTAP